MNANAIAGPSRLVTATRPTSKPSNTPPSKLVEQGQKDLRASSGWGWKGAMDAVKICATFGFWGPSDAEASSETTSSPRVRSPQARQPLIPVGIPRPSPAPPRVCDSAARARLEQALSHGRLVRSLPPDQTDDPSVPTSTRAVTLSRTGTSEAHRLADTTQDEPPAYHTLPRRRPSDEDWEELTTEEDAHLVTPATSRYSTYRSSSPSRRLGTKRPPQPVRHIVHLPMPRWSSEDDDEEESDEENQGRTAEWDERTNRRLDSLSRRMQRLILQGQRALASRAEDQDEHWPGGDGLVGMVGTYHLSPRKKAQMVGGRRIARPASHGILKASVKGRPRVPVRAKSLLAIGIEA